MKTCLWAGAVALACLATVATAQSNLPPIVSGGNIIQPGGLAFNAQDGKPRIVSTAEPLPTTSRVETFRLATANVPGNAATLFGGSYVLTQACASYGTVTLRYLGPDGTTMTAMLTKTASDSAGGTLVSLGASAIVDVTLAGTTGCNVTLSRIP